MRMNVNLPVRVAVDDYHEFIYFQDKLRLIIPGVKVREIGFNGDYLGVAYLGSLDAPRVKAIIAKIKQEERENT